MILGIISVENSTRLFYADKGKGKYYKKKLENRKGDFSSKGKGFRPHNKYENGKNDKGKIQCQICKGFGHEALI